MLEPGRENGRPAALLLGPGNPHILQYAAVSTPRAPCIPPVLTPRPWLRCAADGCIYCSLYCGASAMRVPPSYVFLRKTDWSKPPAPPIRGISHLPGAVPTGLYTCIALGFCVYLQAKILIMDFNDFRGVIIGLSTFLIIGLFHPLVIKAEYHLGKRCWWIFLLAGILFLVLSVLLGRHSFTWSTICGVVAFSSFWSILELFEQEKRVRKGWFPENPARRK